MIRFTKHLTYIFVIYIYTHKKYLNEYVIIFVSISNKKIMLDAYLIDKGTFSLYAL